MRRLGASQSNQWRWWAAGGVLLAGGACAAQLYHTPVRAEGPDARQLRALAQRLSEASAQPPPDTAPLPQLEVRANAAQAAPPTVPARPKAAAPPAPAVRKPSTAPAAIPAPAAPEDPVKNIALIGITRQGDDDQAW